MRLALSALLAAAFLAPETAPRRVALLAPMTLELEPLLARAEIAERRTIARQVHHLGVLAGRDVVMVRCGRSLVAAAATAQAVVDHHDLEAMVVLGIAGGVDPGRDIADVVVPERWGLYQEHVVARQGPAGLDPGHRRRGSSFEAFGMFIPRPQRLSYVEGGENVDENRFWFEADARLLDAARRSLPRVALDRCTADGDCIDDDAELVVAGQGVSGNGFVDNAEYREWIWRTFAANAVDMETAAVAQVAYANDVPFIAFRGLSDLAGGHDGVNRARRFGPVAAGNAAKAAIAFLEALPPV